MPGEFADESVFEGEGYLRHLTYEVHAPADRPLLRVALRDEIPGTVRHSTQPGDDGSVIQRWEVSNVPRMFPEPSMPPGRNGSAAPAGQHHAGLAGGLQMVLGTEQIAPGSHHRPK